MSLLDRNFPWCAKLMAVLLTCVVSPVAVQASDTLTWSGFALVRPQTRTTTPPFFEDDSLSAQIQTGLDWRPRPGFGVHVHLLARNEGDESRRGRVGIVQAFAEKNFIRTNDRFRIIAGAFFLPTSRENIDSLWETPYTISSSALNTWMGEEFRPVGVDLTWMRRFSSAACSRAARLSSRGMTRSASFRSVGDGR